MLPTTRWNCWTFLIRIVRQDELVFVGSFSCTSMAIPSGNPVVAGQVSVTGIVVARCAATGLDLPRTTPPGSVRPPWHCHPDRYLHKTELIDFSSCNRLKSAFEFYGAICRNLASMGASDARDPLSRKP